MKPCKERQGSEIDHIALHLQFTIPYFKDFTRSLISQLVERLVGINFKKGDTLIRQGDVGDSLYIIYAGNCGVYRNKENARGEMKRSKQSVTTLTDGAVVGEQSLNDRQETMLRSAHVIAHSEQVIVLVLTKLDYMDIIQVSSLTQIQLYVQ